METKTDKTDGWLKQVRKTERSKARQKPKKDKTSETKDRQESKFKGLKQMDLGGRKKTDIWTVDQTKDS